MHQIARLVMIAVVLALLTQGTAYAQLEKRFAVGVSVVNFEPEASELSSALRVVPTISRVPKPGWGLALALNWYGADVNGDFVAHDDRFGKLNVRPFMAGIGYTVMRGAWSINPSIVAGPAWNRLEVEDDLRDFFVVGKEDDDQFDDKADTVTFVVRPGISATYAVAPRFGITAFGGYVFNRPKFEVHSTLNGPNIRTEWKADGFTFSAGVVVPIF